MSYLCGSSVAECDAPTRVGWRQTGSAVWRLWVPFFVDPTSRLKAWSMLLSIIVMVLVEVRAQVWMTFLIKDWVNALTTFNEEEFWRVVHLFIYAILILCPLQGIVALLTRVLAIHWRRYLTQRMFVSYIGSDQGYFRLKFENPAIDNPDQRIAQDVDTFTRGSTMLCIQVFRDMSTIIANSSALFHVAQVLFWSLSGFSVVYILITLQCFVAPLMFVQRRLLGLEADLRFKLMRLRENAESIAFFQGYLFESEHSAWALERIIKVMYQQANIQAVFESYSLFGQHLTSVLSFMILAPLYFQRKVTLGAISQAQALFTRMLGGMLDLTKQMDTIAGLGAQAIRVHDLWVALDKMHEAKRKGSDQADANKAVEKKPPLDDDAGELSTEAPESDESDPEEGHASAAGDAESRVVVLRELERAKTADIEGGERNVNLMLEGVTLYAPFCPTPLIDGLNLRLTTGESLMIMGPSGAGKSSLLRAIGGLWSSGSGVVSRTALRQCFFVPQSPYLCQGSLRENILYPYRPVEDSDTAVAKRKKKCRCWRRSGPNILDVGGAGAPQGPMEPLTSDADIRRCLERLGIQKLIERHGLDIEQNWDAILSGGEKQRISFARLLLRPGLSFAILDEATSALDEENESLSYALVREQVGCYVSVGHRANLKKFHTQVLELEPQQDGCHRGVVAALEN